MLNKLLFLLIINSLAGCFGYSISNIDKPNPFTYETWQQKGKSITDIKISLLECGEPSVFEINYDSYEKVGVYGRDETINYGYLASRCMENIGYRQKRRTWFYNQKTCDSLDAKKYPACQDGAEIPKPSKQKRLTSHYCKIKKESFNECKDNKTSNCGEMSYIPWECFTEEEFKEAEIYKTGRGSKTNTKSSNTGSHYNPEETLMRNQQIEADKFQNQIRQQTNKEMNRMLKQ